MFLRRRERTAASVVIGEDVFEALRVWESRARRTVKRVVSLARMAVLRSALGEGQLCLFNERKEEN